MWWWIAGIVIALLILFACWIAWELYHAPMMDDILDGFILDDDEKNESEDAGSNQ